MNSIMTILILIIILLMIICGILLYSVNSRNKKIAKLKNTNQKVNALSVLQDFMKIIGNNMKSVHEKINEINETLIEKYEIKYSTIVIFDGNDYNVVASNVDTKHWHEFENLQSQDSIFFDSVKDATPKYITVEKGEKLPYLEMEFERAKSAIFFPMYIDGVYIGCWLIEGSIPHEFDKINTNILDVIKNNLLSAIRCMRNQNVLENMYRTDKITGLKTYEYLYGTARKVFDKYPMSVVSLIKIINLAQIRNKIGAKIADDVLIHVSKFLQNSLSSEYFCLKYSDDTLIIMFSGSDLEGAQKFMQDEKNNIEKIRIKILSSLNERMNGLVVTPKLNIVMTTYYKETELEQIIGNLYKYLENTDKSESSVSCL